MKSHFLTAVALVAAAPLVQAQTTWAVDKTHSSVTFSAVHMLISETEGEFKEFDVTVSSPADDFNGADVTFSANVASISTDNARRDEHLRSDDFFNAAQFPQLTFKGKLVKSGDKYALTGDLTIRDVTKPVSFEVTYLGTVASEKFKFTKAGFKLRGSINRYDFGLKYNAALETGGLVVGEVVEFTCKVEMNKQS
jgi:polyisoprenoid-binding protein YceI